MNRLLSLALAAFLLVSCSQSSPEKAPEATVVGKGELAHSPNVPEGQAQVEPTTDGSNVVIHNKRGQLFVEAEGILAPQAFSNLMAGVAHLPEQQRLVALNREMDLLKAELSKTRSIILSTEPTLAYFTMLVPYDRSRGEGLLGTLKSLKLPRDRSFYFSPIAYDLDSLKQVKSLTPRAEGFQAAASSPRASTETYSGLNRMKAIEFAALAERAIGGGVKVNGSSVKLGVVDTGITYNHPTFREGGARDAKSRITYMRDFTREGRVYFNLAAKFAATAAPADSDHDFVVNAQVITTPRMPTLPAGDTLADIADLKIKASAELKSILASENHGGAKLSMIVEDAFRSMGEDTESPMDDETVDINRNGKVDDKLYVILVPGATAADDRIFVDTQGTGDFSKAAAIGDFNKTGQVQAVFSEKIGFDFRADKLPKADASGTMDVRSASIVGFDPGNHGTHVAGIAGGRKTIANDSDDTLARGVAPLSQLLMNRVCANNGGCNATQAIIDLANKGGADVINMSLGGLSSFNDGFGVQETVINRLTSVKNTLFVISAGNSGPGRQTIGSPSVARLSLSVGASATQGMIQNQYLWNGSGASTDELDDDFMLFFTSRGPTAAGGFKPNLSAPGTELSAVQLNAAPGARSGLDVYWGTSMAAPAATGAYALLLDGIKKYNERNPGQALTTNSLILREVLIDTARPFDVKRFNPKTGEILEGQYTWIDQGKGMVDLVAAWNKLFELRDNALASAVVDADGKAVELDYSIVTSMKAPNGNAYDGSRAWSNDAGVKAPAFGTGLYLDFYAADTLRQAYIARRLPENLSASEQAGDLEMQLSTTADEFALETVYYGSNQRWLKVGTRTELGCGQSDEGNLRVVGRGVEIHADEDGTGTLNGQNFSVLNVCVDREKLKALPQGDQGALILGYRIVNGKRSVVPAFTLPVYVTIPHQTLSGSTAFQIHGVVKGFGVNRNYVTVPKGATIVRMSIEVPEYKPETGCMGVELMALEGGNIVKGKEKRPALRIANCDAEGAPTSEKRKLALTRTAPKAAIWDVHVFGRYQYPRSTYTLRVDYVVAKPSVDKIEGDVAALTGSVDYTVVDSSLPISPDPAKSGLELNSLVSNSKSNVQHEKHVYVDGALGKVRSYPADAKKVTVTTGGAPENDLDMTVLECPAVDSNLEDPAICTLAAESAGPADVESASFEPKAGKFYAIKVQGYSVEDEGDFESGESIELTPEKGSVTITGESPVFHVAYSLSAADIAASKLLNHTLFVGGKCQVGGALTLRSAEDLVLGSVPVLIRNSAVVPAPGPSATPAPVL